MSLGNRNTEGFLSPIGSIKESLKNKDAFGLIGGQGDDEFRMDTFIVNQNNLLLELLQTASIFNKGKRKYLNVFIKKYIAQLSIDQDNELLSKLYYYLEVYELDTLMGNDKLDNEILIDTNSYSKGEILEELLFNNIYLPEYTNQKDFNESMLALLDKVESRINKYRQKRNPVVFSPVYSGRMLTYMDDVNTNTVKGVKYFDKGVIKNIGYEFSLNSRADSGLEDEFSINLMIDLKSDNSFSREEYIRHLEDDLSKHSLLDELNYFYAEDNNFRYSIYVGETFFEKKGDIDSEGFSHDFEEKEFEIKIQAESKHDYKPEDTLNNVCLRLPALAEQVVTDIYETYGRDSNGETGYPTKRETFNINNIFNSEEDKVGNPFELGSVMNPGIDAGTKKESKHYTFYSPEDINYSLKDLILDDKIMEPLEEILDFFKYTDFYIENNGELFSGMVLAGPAGTGKTTLCKVLGKESGAGVFHFSPNQEEALIGESAKHIESNYKDIEKYIDETGNNAIAFIDEADTIFSVRGGSVKDFKEGMLSVQLQQMDGFNKKYKGKLTFVFGTNRKDIIDPAILSRCDKELLLDLPTEKNRAKILDLHIAKKMEGMKIPMYEHADLDLDLIAITMGKKSGRFIKNLVSHAHNKALKQLREDKGFIITTQIFLDSIEVVEKKEENIEKVMGFNIKNN